MAKPIKPDIDIDLTKTSMKRVSEKCSGSCSTLHMYANVCTCDVCHIHFFLVEGLHLSILRPERFYTEVGR